MLGQRERLRYWLSVLAVASGVCGLLGGPEAVQAQLSVGDRMAQIDSEIATLLSEMEESEARGGRREKELAGLRSRKQTAQRHLRGRARILYRLSRVGMWPLGGGIDSMLKHVARIKRLQGMVASDLKAIKALEMRTQAVARARAETETRSTIWDRRLQMLQEQKQRLAQEVDAYRQFHGAFETKPSMEHGVDSLGSDSGFGIRYSDPSSYAFSTERGRLSFPVFGATEIQDGQRDDGPGLEFLVPSGTAAYSVANGRVAFANRYGRYGELVIIGHGDSYFSVYGGLAELRVRVGDSVQRGTMLGQRAQDAPGRAVFFELRQGTRTLPVRQWLGI
ncbi:MAG: M23 family metallopeptidase [Myxococcota bacterium]